MELAVLLDMTPETISRWELGKLRVERLALALAGAPVFEREEGRTTMLDHLRTLKPPPHEISGQQRLALTPSPAG